MYHNVQMFHTGVDFSVVSHDVLAGLELLSYIQIYMSSCCCPKAQKSAGTEALALDRPRL